MKKNVALILLFSSLSLASFSQKFIIGLGYNLYTDVAMIEPASGLDGNSQIGFSIFSMAVEMKYNIVEFNTDLALSIATGPGFGSMMIESLSIPGEQIGNTSSFGNFRIPVLLQLDFGNLSTFETMKDKGFGIGVGFEYNRIGVFSDGENSFDGFISPTFRAGFRYFNANNKAREIALKYTLPKDVDFNYTQSVNGQSVDMTTTFNVSMITLSWITYFNY